MENKETDLLDHLKQALSHLDACITCHDFVL